MADPVTNERQILKAALGRTSQCLSVEVLAAIADEPSRARTSMQARQHLGECAHCQSELALFREFQEAEARPAERSPVAWIESELRRRSDEIIAKPAEEPESLWARVTSGFEQAFTARHWRGWSLAAASLLVVVTAGIYLRSGAEPERLGGPLIYRSQTLSAVAPAGEIREAPASFQWQPAPAASKYRVNLMEVDRTPVWSSESTGNSISIPAAEREKMTPGRAFLWEVSAFDATGARIGSSNLQNFHIAITTQKLD